MERSPGQLALPLFEPEVGAPTPEPPDPQPRAQNGSWGVVSGRAESRRVAPARAAVPSMPQAAAPLLTTQEAADLLRVHPRTVQRLVERGQLGAVHLGAAVRFDPADVAALTERLKQRGAGIAPSCADVVRPSHASRISFADRFRSQPHEH